MRRLFAMVLATFLCLSFCISAFVINPYYFSANMILAENTEKHDESEPFATKAQISANESFESSIPAESLKAPQREGEDNTAFTLSTAEVYNKLESIRSSNSTDENLIKETISLLFDVKCDQLSGAKKADFDYQIFWDTTAGKKSGLQYFEDSIAVTKGTHARTNAYLYDTNVVLTFEDAEITGNNASVSVYEWFSFKDSRIKYDDMITGSGVGIEYQIKLVKVEGTWYISDIDFYDETTEPLKDGKMSIEQLLNSRCAIVEPVPLLPNDKKPAAEIKSQGIVTYLDTSNFVSYAADYSSNTSGTSSYNPNFPHHYPKDCQNFASQCLWYGFGGVNSASYIGSKARPMVTSGNYPWYEGSSDDYSDSWISCTNFGNYISNHSYGEGLFGDIDDGISKACVGDLIQYSENNNTTYNHVYVVVAVSGTYGSRTPSNITVCAHTTNRCNNSLADAYHANYTWRTIHVTHHWRPLNDAPVE